MDNKSKILIVEDEMLIAAKISMYLTEMDYEVTGILARGEEVLLHLQVETPDIILLDIQLKGEMDGIDLAETLQKKHQIPVIYLTANFDEASFSRAKTTKPYAFLSKPFKKRELKRALELTLNLIEKNPSVIKEDSVKPEDDRLSILSDRIFIYHQEKRVKIMFEAILFVQAERNYCRIVTSKKEYLLTMPMKSLEKELPKSIFQRIHRSHLVNLFHVEEVSEAYVKVDTKYLILSKSYRQEFLQRIQMI